MTTVYAVKLPDGSWAGINAVGVPLDKAQIYSRRNQATTRKNWLLKYDGIDATVVEGTVTFGAIRHQYS